MSHEIPNYSLLRKLGEGAMAEVWLGEHKRNARKAAIKILKPMALADADFEKLFLREGQVLAGFDHPNIVRIYDNDRIGDTAFLAMELLAGGTLLERMQRGPIAIGEALGLIVQIAGALEAAHRQGVIHRDLKPANIMLRDETTPVLTDFGAARLVDRSTIYGKDGMIVGTPVYMSPEQVTGQALSGASDLYALGVLFFELLTGTRPFPGASFPEIAAQHLHAPIPRLPAAIGMLQPVLERLLAKKPEDRYRAAQAFIDDLRLVFIHDEALRQQVGYAATSHAWSSQLRALGFVLDSVQKAEVRIAQGEYLRGQAGTPTTAPNAPLAAPSTTPQEPVAGARPRGAAWIAAAALAMAVIGAGLWWSRPASLPPSEVPSLPAVVEPERALPTTHADSPPAAPPESAATDDDEPPRDLAGADTGAPSTDAETARAQAERAVAALALRARFVAPDDDTLLDTDTGLTWASSDNGEDIDWFDAGKYCEELGPGWKLPSSQQLQSLYDETGTFRRRCGEVECSVTPLLDITAGFHWSGQRDGDLGAFAVDFANGARQGMASINPFHLRVLCVRGGGPGRAKD